MTIKPEIPAARSQITESVGSLYESGNAVTQNKKKANMLYKAAAEYGSDMGMLAHGVALIEKAKTEKDISNAVFWLWRAACSDLGEAQLALGRLLNEPDSPIYDMDQSIYWLSRATENKCEGAASAFADAYLKGIFNDGGTPYNLGDIIAFLEDALNRGDSAAAKTLGDFSQEGLLSRL